MGLADTLSQKGNVDTSDDSQMVTLLSPDNTQLHDVWILDLALTEKITASPAPNLIVTKALQAMVDNNIDPWLP